MGCENEKEQKFNIQHMNNRINLKMMYNNILILFEKNNYIDCYLECRDYLFFCIDNDVHTQEVMLMACHCAAEIFNLNLVFAHSIRKNNQEFYDLMSRFLDQYPKSQQAQYISWLRINLVKKSLSSYCVSCENDKKLLSLCDIHFEFYGHDVYEVILQEYYKESICRIFAHYATLALHNQEGYRFLGAALRWQEILFILSIYKNKNKIFLKGTLDLLENSALVYQKYCYDMLNV